MRIFVSLFFVFVFHSASQAGNLHLQIKTNSYSLPVVSMQERRWHKIVRQQYDYSCGSAVIASLLTYHYEMPTTEIESFTAMYNAGNQEKIKAQGFSMLDMKAYLDSLDLNASGFRISLDELNQVGVPGITMISINGYRHFVLIKGIEKNKVLVGDPAAGIKIYRRSQFEKMWNGIILAVRRKGEVGRRYFNLAEEWSVQLKAPVDSLFVPGTRANRLYLLPGMGEFAR